MAKKKEAAAVEAAPVVDRYWVQREKIREKVCRAGYDAFFDGSILMVKAKPEEKDNEELKEAVFTAILDTGYDGSYGITFH